MKKLMIFAMFVILQVCFLPTLRAEGTKEYKVGIDDVLEISVLQPEKITAAVTVSPDGSISFPYIGNVAIKGMTLTDIQDRIQKRLADGYMKYPVVSVSLKESRSRKFFVYGDIAKPGAYPMDDETTILKAISISGGFSKYGTASLVKIIRPKLNEAGYDTIEVNMKDVMQGSGNSNTLILPGDTIMVSEGKFFVYGDVAKPGAYSMDEGTTVLKAISVAGGFVKSGSSSQVRVLRPKEKGAGYETIEVNIKSLLQGNADADVSLRPQDTIMVSEGKFFVYGDVAKPGSYQMDEGASVLKAISVAGGFLKNGSATQVKVLRLKADGKSVESINVDINAAMKGGTESDIAIYPGDTVTVSQDKFFVYGEVNKPGVYPLEEDITVLKAIAIAGGFTKYGSSSRVKVLRAKADGTGYENIKVNIKEIMDGASDSDIVLKPSDTVVVFEGIF